ncbi:hypothetical protein FGG78_13870 [Thioclava sp. BHET1]|nr:hypothetical protein FGG78_13870 [Thioclava sp. BHET1]
MRLLSILYSSLNMTVLVTSGLLYLHDPQAWWARVDRVRGVLEAALIAEAENRIRADRGEAAAPAADTRTARSAQPRAQVPQGIAPPRHFNGKPVAEARFVEARPSLSPPTD